MNINQQQLFVPIPDAVRLKPAPSIVSDLQMDSTRRGRKPTNGGALTQVTTMPQSPINIDEVVNNPIENLAKKLET